MLAPWLPVASRHGKRVKTWWSPRNAGRARRHPASAAYHIAPLPRSLWDSEVVGWVVQKVWLNQNNVFVGILRAQRFKHAPSDDASIFTLCTIFSESGHA